MKNISLFLVKEFHIAMPYNSYYSTVYFVLLMCFFRKI